MSIHFKPIALIVALALMIAPLALAEEPAGAAADAALPDWTVLVYMCGCDMETNSGMATYNLDEIMLSYQPYWATHIDEAEGKLVREAMTPRVNVAVQTGGALEWQNDSDEDDSGWSLEIANDKLQRYVLSHEELEEYGIYPLELVEELPMASMADPETLTDFIRWGVETYPAQKYMLVLWGHGNGASTGMIIDEVYDDDILYLYELDGALAEAGVHFECVLLDACMMCNMETACIFSKYADWMVASEELAPGYGTAFKKWLNELFMNPSCGGGQLGTTICDVTHEKYSAMEDTSNMAMTWAVLELSQMDRVAEAFNDLYEYVDFIYEKDPADLQSVLAILMTNKCLGTGSECMYDMGELLKGDQLECFIDVNIRNALANAMYDAVFYSVNGIERAGNYGLSYCYPITMSPERMDIYARNCGKIPAYLAFLDAGVPDWEAPDWVYEQTARLTPCEQIPKFSNMPEEKIEDGVPVLYGKWDDNYTWRAYWELYREDDFTGELQRLGFDTANTEIMDDGYRITMDNPSSWPSIDDVLCSIEYTHFTYMSDYDITGDHILFYNVPVQMGSDQMNLSLGYVGKYDWKTGGWQFNYKVYGTTQGFDEERGAPNRSAKPLSRLQGQEFELLYPVYTEDDSKAHYGSSEPLTMYRGLEVEEITLPEGTYYCRYIVENCLLQRFRTNMVKLYWDGSAFSVMAE